MTSSIADNSVIFHAKTSASVQRLKTEQTYPEMRTNLLPPVEGFDSVSIFYFDLCKFGLLVVLLIGGYYLSKKRR